MASKNKQEVNFIQIVQTTLEKIVAAIHQDFVGSGDFKDQINFENGSLYFYGKNEYQAKTNKSLFLQTCTYYNIIITQDDENHEEKYLILQSFQQTLDNNKDKVYR